VFGLLFTVRLPDLEEVTDNITSHGLGQQDVTNLYNASPVTQLWSEKQILYGVCVQSLAIPIKVYSTLQGDVLSLYG